MLLAAGAISIDIHQLTGEAIPFLTILTYFRALLLFLAQLTLRKLMHLIGVLEIVSTGAFRIDIADD
jgi:hypothetical protein